MKIVLGPHNERLARLAIKDLEKSLRGERSSYVRIDLPEPATIKEVKAARKAVASTQRQFAELVGVSLETVKSWEAGKRTPEGIASKVMRILIKKPKIARELLASV
jgi:putative transcriptional regulator